MPCCTHLLGYNTVTRSVIITYVTVSKHGDLAEQVDYGSFPRPTYTVKVVRVETLLVFFKTTLLILFFIIIFFFDLPIAIDDCTDRGSGRLHAG